MHRDMVDEDRVVREGRVEIVAVQQAAVRHDVVVIAVAWMRSPFGICRSSRELLELGDDAFGVLRRPGGRRITLTWFATSSELM